MIEMPNSNDKKENLTGFTVFTGLNLPSFADEAWYKYERE